MDALELTSNRLINTVTRRLCVTNISW